MKKIVPQITKIDFVNIINMIKDFDKENKTLTVNFAKCFKNARTADLMLTENDKIIEKFVSVLGKIFKDSEGNWIDYFCYELDFGRKNDTLKIFENNKEVKLSTPEDLYLLLIKNMQKNAL